MTDLIEILGKLVEADRAAGRSETFVLVYTARRYEIIGHPIWRESSDAPSDVEVDELADQRWVRITAVNGKQRKFAITSAGREAWDEHLRRTAPTTGARVALDWGTARPVLRRIFEAYEDGGAAEEGVDILAIAAESDDPRTTQAHIRELARAGFLQATFTSASGPRFVRPSPVALQMLAGWPSGAAEDALEGLAHAIDSAIEHTSDPERRSRLESVRAGLLGAARDVALTYFEKKVMGL